MSQLIDPVSDLPAVTRLFELYTLDAQLAEALDGMSPVITPDDFSKTATVRLRVASEVRQLESALGLSPRSRLALGLALLAGRKAGTLDEAADDAND